MADNEEKQQPKAQKIAKDTTKPVAKAALKQLATPKKLTGRPVKGKPRSASDDDGDSDAGAGENDDGDEDSEPEDEESETDFSDMTISDSDNDRDSDLDFNVNDRSMSKRPRKSKKKRAMAKAKRLEKAARKQRRNNDTSMDVSDPDVSTPARRKSGKVQQKKTLTTRTPPDASPSGSVKGGKPSAAKVVKQSQRDKLINILRDSKEPVIVLKKHPAPQPPTVVQSPPALIPSPSAVVHSENAKPIGTVKKEKKPFTYSNVASDTVSLFTSPDIIKQVSKVEPVKAAPKVYASASLTGQQLTTPTTHRPVSHSIGFVPLSPQHGVKNRNIPTQISVRVHASPASTANAAAAAVAATAASHTPTKLASEQDKQLDLIDSIVQQELNESHRTYSSTKPSSTIILSTMAATATAIARPPQKILNHTLAQNDIPDIVKMLETSSESSSICTQSEPTNLILNSTLVMPTVSTELQFSTNITSDSHLLDDDLLQSFAIPEDGLTEDLMQHVAQLAEDKNLQKIIDTQVLGVALASSPITPNKPAATTTTIVMTPLTAPTAVRPAEKESPFVKFAMQREAQKAAQASAARATGPITIVRPGGRVITLPPIEAPATRGAKRRAETGPTSEPAETGHSTRRDSKEASAIVAVPRKLSSDLEGAATGKLDAALGKVKDQDRRGSANKRVSTEIRTPKRLSVASANNTADDYDDEDDDEKSDGSYNSEDDPLRWLFLKFVFFCLICRSIV